VQYRISQVLDGQGRAGWGVGCFHSFVSRLVGTSQSSAENVWVHTLWLLGNSPCAQPRLRGLVRHERCMACPVQVELSR
jgi:hypothetical protein